MKKRVIIYSLVLVWVAVLLQLVVVAGMRSDDKIMEAFQAGNSVPVKSTLTITGTYGKYLIAAEEQKELLDYIAKGMDISRYDFTSEPVASISSENSQAKTCIRLQKDASGQKETVITKIELTDSIDSIIALKEKASRIYSQLDMKPDCFISMQGTYAGELDKGRKEQMKETIFKVLESRDVEKQKVSGADIYYGFTQRLDMYQIVNGKKVNTQLIYTYDEKANETSLYLAVPYYNQDF